MTTAGTGGRGLADPADERSNCGVGVVMNLGGGRERSVVRDGLELLANLEHRGATGAEPNTGDGAGITLEIPHDFFAETVDADLPAPGAYAVGALFLPDDPDAATDLKRFVEERFAAEGLDVLAWRSVPRGDADLGATAVESEPEVVQVFVESREGLTGDALRRRLYVARRVVENAVESERPPGHERFYVVSLDPDVLVYKGLLLGTQLADYYPDLRDERVRSTFVMVHARFSTNTLGAWHLAHPYRRIIHNGEFNTIQGNVNWMRARETDLVSDAFGDDLEKLLPVVDDPDQSDTASVDNVLELLLLEGRDLPEALRTLIPEAWRDDANDLSPGRQAWYDYHASVVEPWDGPALVAATDGDRVGAVLDRNGLRPCRYDVLEDDTLIVASEAGALDTDPAEVRERGRLQPGELFLADPEAGRIVPDDEIFDDLTDPKYAEWVAERQVAIDDLVPEPDPAPEDVPADLRAHQRLYGYTRDELDELVAPMAEDGADPVGAMGDDTPLSVLSDGDRPLASYFKQLFAQVTNPPLDYIREELVTSLESRLGHQRNLLGESPAHARQLVLDSPILTDDETAAIRGLDRDGLAATTLDLTFDPETDLRAAVERLRERANAAAADHDVLVLSDREAGPDRLAIPSLLAVGAVHHHLVRTGRRNHVGLVVESGDPRTVHQVATLVGYGAGAVNPYLAYESVADLVGGEGGPDPADAVAAYVGALEDGLLKTMSKMGISTVESYQGAQIFEAVGLDTEFVDEYFEGTENRTDGVGMAEIEADLRGRHEAAFGDPEIERTGEFHHRTGGTHHAWNPETIGTLQEAVREGDYETYQEYADLANDGTAGPTALRGLLTFADDRESVPLEEVEPVESIVERFETAAMSLGSLSPEMHETNAVAMNRIGGGANTGEGGEPPERFGTERECSTKQVASGRFGVTAEYLAAADELQIKMAQGSKPGEGGHLPGGKVNEMIAGVRHSTPGVGLISPAPQHDIYSIEDLKQLIHDLNAANPEADVNVKLVAERGIGTVAAGVAKAGADVVHVSGHSGGTGASPKTSIKHAGLPWELGVAEANQLLRETGLRSRVKITTDGGLRTGRDVAVAALLGAEGFTFGTASLVTAGCVMARQCHENTCPVGIATQDEDLRERFPGEPRHVVNYMRFLARDLREIMADLGFRTVEEMVGRVDALRQRADLDDERAASLDLSGLLATPADAGAHTRDPDREPKHDREDALDRGLIDAAEPALTDGEPVGIDARVDNEDRAVGATLSNRVVRATDGEGLPEDTVAVRLDGAAGQSFGAFLAEGVTLSLSGPANDYLGKGLSGGKLLVRTPEEAGYDAADNVVAGNVALYGATDGECYVNGRAGERFAVRNSGVSAVVEGVGDHGCEYMTGGVVVVLGETGKNFAAGMSGGVAYVYDPDDEFADRVNRGMVSTYDDLEAKDERVVRRLVENHAAYTGSERARELLADDFAALEEFVAVLPDAYADVIERRDRADVRDTRPQAASDALSARPAPTETLDD